MNAAGRRAAAKRGAAKALLSLDNDAARAMLAGRSTPAPWRIEQGENGLAIYAEAAYSIAWVFHEQEANARLIAAAPELLDVVREAAEEMDTWMLERTPTADDIDKMRSEFRAILAKAALNQFNIHRTEET